MIPFTEPSVRALWLRRWLIALNLLLIAAGLFLAATWSRRALILVVGVPVAFAPFSLGRWWLERYLSAHVAAPRALALFAIFGIGADTVMVAQVLTARTVPGAELLHGPLLGWVGPVWFSSFAIVAVALGVHRYLLAPARRLVDRVRPRREPAMDPGRRQFLRQATVFGAGVPFAASVSGANISYDFRVEEHEVLLPHWPTALDGLRVAHLSDIHVGGAMDRERLLRVAALTNAARPDLVVHTGDFLTHRDGDFDLPLYEALARIQAPHGQWACLGNHDFDDPNRLVQKMREAGVQTLRNRLATIVVDGQELEIAGIDYAFGRFQWEEIYARIVASWGPRRPVPRILLNHDPTAFATLPPGCADLVCSGHTHGGQIGVQFGAGRALTLVGLLGVPDQGVFARDDMRLFVTRCVGFYGYPMRIGIPPEVAILTIRREPESRPVQA
jgi:predicted MPP superfamily phosphohydrolase